MSATQDLDNAETFSCNIEQAIISFAAQCCNEGRELSDVIAGGFGPPQKQQLLARLSDMLFEPRLTLHLAHAFRPLVADLVALKMASIACVPFDLAGHEAVGDALSRLLPSFPHLLGTPWLPLKRYTLEQPLLLKFSRPYFKSIT